MTRKQALLKAINECTDPKVKEKLSDIYQEMPLIHWSKKSVLDALENYYLETGKRPTVSTLHLVSGLPPHPVIKSIFGINAKEFLNLHFPPEKDEEQQKKEYQDKVIQDFIAEYNRLKPSSAKDYDERRNRECKCSITVCRVANCKWSELIPKLELQKYINKKPVPKIDIVSSVTVTYLGQKL